MKAPGFTLPDQHNQQRSLADFKGQWLVLYFYPKDNTPGCTAQACSFRDAGQALADLSGAAVVGISTDSVESHRRFAAKHGLNYPLLSDPDHTVIAAYGAWGPRKLFGREFMGTKRNTYLISPDSEIAKQYAGVNPRTNAGQVLADLQQLQAN